MVVVHGGRARRRCARRRRARGGRRGRRAALLRLLLGLGGYGGVSVRGGCNIISADQGWLSSPDINNAQ